MLLSEHFKVIVTLWLLQLTITYFDFQYIWSPESNIATAILMAPGKLADKHCKMIKVATKKLPVMDALKWLILIRSWLLTVSSKENSKICYFLQSWNIFTFFLQLVTLAPSRSRIIRFCTLFFLVLVSLWSKLNPKYCCQDKFSGFNSEIEEITATQKRYSIPDVELRESLKRDNKEYILPKYNSFYEKYVNVNFSKNPEKYIKYTPAQVSGLIDSFFDVAA